MPQRNSYIDFLRALGLILLVGVHVNAPEWYVPMRSFDVPLMVVVSALCYKPLRGGYLRYGWKRFKRIYIPVFVFLTLFFIASAISFQFFGKPDWGLGRIIGSYALVNGPSIGYVWIMRVFLIMAILLPFLDQILRKSNFWIITISIFGIVAMQQYFVELIDGIGNKYVRFGFDEVVLYGTGYSPLAILGLKIKEFKRSEVLIFVTATWIAILGFIYLHGWEFNPQAYKYPPQSLYVLYGLFAGSLLWYLKPLLEGYTTQKYWGYLSRNSMWVYLWHIIPVYLITPWANVPDMWFGRYCVVFAVAILFNQLYQISISYLPEKVRTLIK